MEDYKPNSNKYKEEQRMASLEQKRVSQKVVSGVAKTKKKSEVRKMADNFFSEDISRVKDYVLKDVLVPAIKDTISEMIKSGVDMMFFGESRHGKKSSTPASRISYTGFYNSGNSPKPTRAQNLSRSTYSYDDILFDNRGDAEAVLDQLCLLIDSYNWATVGDLYDLAGITGDYTSRNYGWMDLHTAKVVKVRGGYVIDLPKAMPVD